VRKSLLSTDESFGREWHLSSDYFSMDLFKNQSRRDVCILQTMASVFCKLIFVELFFGFFRLTLIWLICTICLIISIDHSIFFIIYSLWFPTFSIAFFVTYGISILFSICAFSSSLSSTCSSSSSSLLSLSSLFSVSLVPLLSLSTASSLSSSSLMSPAVCLPSHSLCLCVTSVSFSTLVSDSVCFTLSVTSSPLKLFSLCLSLLSLTRAWRVLFFTFNFFCFFYARFGTLFNFAIFCRA